MGALTVNFGLDALHLVETAVSLQQECGVILKLRLVAAQKLFYVVLSVPLLRYSFK